MEKAARKKIARVIMAIAAVFLSLVCAEIFLRMVYGLGRPVLYDSSPLYGFRPLPNQECRRTYGARLVFNNLGLRADHDFDDDPNGKILFLGDSVTYGGSYVDNNDLFSSLAVKGLSHYVSGNAGVNAWGVENIYGLIVERPFLPASVYVTTLAEEDFYRGLVRCQGVPFSNVAPGCALIELWWAFCYGQNERRYRHWTAFSSEQEKEYVVEKAARRLQAMDTFLRERGFLHLLFITPTRDQVLGNRSKDSLVQGMLVRHGLEPIYIADRLNGCNLVDSARRGLFHDALHLDKAGHSMWAKIIREDLERILPQR